MYVFANNVYSPTLSVQVPLVELRSDGRTNLVDSLLIAGEYIIPEVCGCEYVCMCVSSQRCVVVCVSTQRCVVVRNSYHSVTRAMCPILYETRGRVAPEEREQYQTYRPRNRVITGLL